MKPWQQITIGILIGLLASGLILLVSSPKQGNPIVLSPAPTSTQTPIPRPTASPSPIFVQIGGEISNPGVYAIDKQARLADLIELAGGLTHLADIDRVNNAAVLRDGDYFYIPAQNEMIPDTARNAPHNLANPVDNIDYPLDLNKATQEELESLPGIGPTKAAEILAYRDQKGFYASLDELMNVPGIGEATLDSLRDYLIIEP